MKLALGTAQFGLDYGITNNLGKVPIDQIEEILNIAAYNKINTIDTAIAYGTSEQTLGLFDLSKFKVVSKLPSLECCENINLRQQVEGSLDRLRISKLYGLMLHREGDAIEKNSDKVFEQLLELKLLGLVDKIGVSFYSPSVAKTVIERYPIDIIQVPANCLDNRFCEENVFSTAGRLGVELHLRSVFLQGLLATPVIERPERFREHKDLLKFDLQAECLGLTLKEMAMSYLLKQSEVVKGVVGCVNSSQLAELISIYNKLKYLKIPDTDLSSRDENLINPSLW